MFNVGPLELLVLAAVGLIVLGPDKLPGLAKDAARLIRALREMATGARTQLRDELGPEFADLDLRNLNPRTALQRAILGDEIDLQRLDPRAALQRAVLGEDAPVNPATRQASGAAPVQSTPQVPPVRPLGRGEQAPYDADAT